MSTIFVNTLTGTSTAGSIAVTGEGNSTTTNLQQGLAKSWVSVNSTGTPAIRESFNVTSVTDDGTGKMRLTTTASFNSIDAMSVGSAAANGVASSSQYLSSGWAKDTNEYWIGAVWGTTLYDVAYTMGTVHGDLG